MDEQLAGEDDTDPIRLLARARADLLELQDQLARQEADDRRGRRRRPRRSDEPENIADTW